MLLPLPIYCLMLAVQKVLGCHFQNYPAVLLINWLELLLINIQRMFLLLKLVVQLLRRLVQLRYLVALRDRPFLFQRAPPQLKYGEELFEISCQLCRSWHDVINLWTCSINTPTEWSSVLLFLALPANLHLHIKVHNQDHHSSNNSLHKYV